MQLNADLIRKLNIPFSEVLPSGALKDIREQFNMSEHTPRKVLTGEWTNEAIANEALERVRRFHRRIGDFLAQFEPGAEGD